ncbi:WD40/YVTN/BNR-like repeat-containing protein [Chloroflexota bacterium]
MKTKKLKGVLGIGLSAGLVFTLIGTIFASPVSADLMEWGIVNTPSWEDYEIFPNSDILDYAVGGDGDTVYAVLQPLIGLFSNGNGSAEWSTSYEQSGSYSAMLSGGVQTGSDYAAVIIPVNGALMLDQITTFDYDYFFVTGPGDGYGPHMCFYTHDPNDGETAEITLFSGLPAAGNDFYGTPYGGTPGQTGLNTVNITTATTGFGWFGSESESGFAQGFGANARPLSDYQTATGFEDHVIDRIQIEYGWWGAGDATEAAYVDDVIINSDMCFPIEPTEMLLKTDDGGVTWNDITANVQGAANLPEDFVALGYVDVASDDEDWLAVVGTDDAATPMVVASNDGGDNFTYTGAMNDAGDTMDMVYDLAVSIEVDDIHNIAVAGISSAGGSVFRLKAGTWLSAAWEDTTDADYLGWDNGVSAATAGVVACEFSDNFDLDDTIVCLGVNGIGSGLAYLQSGIWESAGSWNSNAGFPNAAEIEADGDTLLMGVYMRSVGLALPADYDGSDPGARAVFLYVNAYNTTTNLVGGCVFRADNNTLSPVCGPAGNPLLASIDVHGDADTGKLMIGEYMRWDNDAGDPGDPVPFNCCEGVRVWHTEELDFCCPAWDGACKDPSGPYLALVAYTPDGDKAYATTSGTLDPEFPFQSFWGGLGDESAFSVSRDDGVSFNQLSLIDTDIDNLSDVAVCPDCTTIYLSTFNSEEECEVCACDSVWRSYDDGDTWERVYHGNWTDDPYQHLLLRLPCDAIEDCCDQDPVSPSGTVYLAIQESDQIYYSRDCGQCWNDPPATKDDIQDVAVESENIVYILHEDGSVSKSTQYGRRWSDPVDTDIGSGHTIAACCNEGFVVVGGESGGKVAWSDDGGESWNLTDALPGTANSWVVVACDPVCENIIYAAVDSGGIYRTDVTNGAWDTISALMMDYTGIVVAREGTLYASFDNIWEDPSVDDVCDPDRFAASSSGSHTVQLSGVARNLDPCETDCCGAETWDYLVCGLTDQGSGGEDFDNQPSALRICGCLSIDTNSILWAIDWTDYDVSDGSDGSLWSYEDCAAKIGPTLTAPADGTVIDCEPCAGCDAAAFTLKWERMCEACSYDIQIMDADGNTIVEWTDVDITGDPPSLFVDGTLDVGYYYLECGENYTWKVREANTACECVHSPWSETWSFTIAVGAADAINPLAPTKGAMDVPIENIGFSWTSVRNATSYSFVLSPNANLAGALVSQDQSTTAFNFVGPLDYSKAYYWQIIAWQDGTRLTTSSIGVFNTMAKPVAPQPPVVIEQQPAPVINIPPAQQITPTWIYAIIGIGAALAVVVIVLIVRTRRP